MDVAQAKWKSTPVKIDGFADEWSKPMSFFDSETKLFFAFGNDSKNLYICFQSSDERNEVKINRAGMKVFIHTKGKEKHNASVDFPLTDSKQNYAAEEVNEEVKPDIPSLKNTFLLQNTNMLTKGFATQNGTFPISDSSGIHAAINWDEKNIMNYELAIPLKELFGANYTDKDLAKTITMVVEVNAISRLDEAEIDVGGTAAGSAAGQSGGMTRSMPGGTKREKRPLFDKNKFKQKFVLAKGA
jgi:hypothetical protein